MDASDPAQALTQAIGRARAVPIGDHGFLSDGEVSALLAPDGSVTWMCVPRFDAPSVFGSLLDREAGLFRLGPFGVTVPSDRHYIPGTNVMVTTWKTPGRSCSPNSRSRRARSSAYVGVP